METLQNNIMSLLDYEHIPSSISHRIKYLSTSIEVEEEEIRQFFGGQQPLPKGAARKIADLFGVDLNWLTSRNKL